MPVFGKDDKIEITVGGALLLPQIIYPGKTPGCHHFSTRMAHYTQ